MLEPGRRSGIAASARRYSPSGWALSALALGVALAGCSRHHQQGEPPHSTQAIVPPPVISTIAVPLDADLAGLQRLLDEQIPKTLWTIDQPGVTCAAPQHVHLFGARLAITPALHCRIVGTVTRGAIALHGSGQDIIADVPLNAVISAQDIGGILKRETATGAAMAEAHIRLAVQPDWSVRGTVRLAYDWRQTPGIDFLGRRITFTDKADARLQPVIARLQQRLPAELNRLDLRAKIAKAWASAFTTLNLNEEKPPVWMQVAPQRLTYGGYTIVDRQLQLRLGMTALTATVVGHRPEDPEPRPLPAMAPQPQETGHVTFNVPVIADYAELEPVIERALAKRAKRPFVLPLGAVTAHFAHIKMYGATNGRIAVGADIDAQPSWNTLPPVQGRLWFVAVPVNAPGSQLVHFRQLSIEGVTNHAGSDLLVELANNPGFADAIGQSLTQNFSHDYGGLLGKIQRALAAKQLGDFVITAHIDAVNNGQLQAAANGLYMPVTLNGTAAITFRP